MYKALEYPHASDCACWIGEPCDCISSGRLDDALVDARIEDALVARAHAPRAHARIGNGLYVRTGRAA